MQMKGRLFSKINNYLSLVKFSHTIFSLPFALIGFFIALQDYEQSFDVYLLGKVLLCVIFARNAAMGFNRFIDREIDLQNKRTALREIPAMIIKPKSALVFVIINSLAFVITTYFINKLCLYLSPIALLVILGYSLTKRFTFLCHLILGIGLSLAPIGAYLSVSGEFSLLPLLFSFAVLFWVGGFDIIYALQDEEFDRFNKLKSLPVRLGKKNALRLSLLFHTISAGFILWAGFNHRFSYLYLSGATVFIALLIYQHLIVKPHNLSRVNLAFFTTNGIASVVFAIFVIADLYLPF